jgi:hypothetical protein
MEIVFPFVANLAQREHLVLTGRSHAVVDSSHQEKNPLIKEDLHVLKYAGGPLFATMG